MINNIEPGSPVEMPEPDKEPEIKEPDVPEETPIPTEEPDKIPVEDPYITPPQEVPLPGKEL